MTKRYVKVIKGKREKLQGNRTHNSRGLRGKMGCKPVSALQMEEEVGHFVTRGILVVEFSVEILWKNLKRLRQ